LKDEFEHSICPVIGGINIFEIKKFRNKIRDVERMMSKTANTSVCECLLARRINVPNPITKK